MKIKNWLFLVIWILPGLCCVSVQAQTNNAISIYESERIQAIRFDYQNLPVEVTEAEKIRQKVEETFKVSLYSHFSWIETQYYLSQIKNLPFVDRVDMDIETLPEGGIALLVKVDLSESIHAEKTNNIFNDIRFFPIIYSDDKSLLRFQFSGAAMLYANDNAWFAQPKALLTGNPLAKNPSGKGWSNWTEGFGSVGLYGITRLFPQTNLHIYGGASFLTAFSKGQELFTDKDRANGELEDAYVGFTGGGRQSQNYNYSYNFTYGRKSFVLGNGWLISNISMNGQDRAALQLNPRGAARKLVQAGFKIDKMRWQFFQIKPNDLSILTSKTTLNGVNLELGNSDKVQIGGTVLHVPKSNFKYYFPDGTVRTRQGLWVYNVRLYGNPPLNESGFFYKAEYGFQRNEYFKMRANAWYAQMGWSFAKVYGSPSLSYRYATFSGDNSDKNTYTRWDALYTGGNNEQWVQGSNMYKIVQNSNETTHMVQLVFSPMKKIQTVTQLWAFLAPQNNNLGGNPGLSYLKSQYYGSEINFTMKYFHSKNWYFHMNTALTIPGGAIKNQMPDAKNWFSWMFFARYTL